MCVVRRSHATKNRVLGYIRELRRAAAADHFYCTDTPSIHTNFSAFSLHPHTQKRQTKTNNNSANRTDDLIPSKVNVRWSNCQTISLLFSLFSAFASCVYLSQTYILCIILHLRCALCAFVVANFQYQLLWLNFIDSSFWPNGDSLTFGMRRRPDGIRDKNAVSFTSRRRSQYNWFVYANTTGSSVRAQNWIGFACMRIECPTACMDVSVCACVLLSERVQTYASTSCGSILCRDSAQEMCVCAC